MLRRFPDYLLAVYRLPVNDRAGLAVRRPQIKADTAATQVTAQRHGRFLLIGNVLCRAIFYREGFFVDRLSHELVIKCAQSTWLIALLQIRAYRRGAACVDPAGAALPQQKFQQPLRIKVFAAESEWSSLNTRVS